MSQPLQILDARLGLLRPFLVGRFGVDVDYALDIGNHQSERGVRCEGVGVQILCTIVPPRYVFSMSDARDSSRLLVMLQQARLSGSCQNIIYFRDAAEAHRQATFSS